MGCLHEDQRRIRGSPKSTEPAYNLVSSCHWSEATGDGCVSEEVFSAPPRAFRLQMLIQTSISVPLIILLARPD
eukprot:6196012-Pleurochrysis_carterae.AAC.2